MRLIYISRKNFSVDLQTTYAIFFIGNNYFNGPIMTLSAPKVLCKIFNKKLNITEYHEKEHATINKR